VVRTTWAEGVGGQNRVDVSFIPELSGGQQQGPSNGSAVSQKKGEAAARAQQRREQLVQEEAKSEVMIKNNAGRTLSVHWLDQANGQYVKLVRCVGGWMDRVETAVLCLCLLASAHRTQTDRRFTTTQPVPPSTNPPPPDETGDGAGRTGHPYHHVCRAQPPHPARGRGGRLHERGGPLAQPARAGGRGAWMPVAGERCCCVLYVYVYLIDD
jgi:hypothetical protein